MAEPMAAPMAGFSADRVGNKSSLGIAVTQHIQCPICRHIFNEPLITRCGHTFCHDCLIRWVRNDTACPECQRELSAGRGAARVVITGEEEEVAIGERVAAVSAARNQLAVSIINDLMIACENRKKGCLGVMAPTALAAHHASCPHRHLQHSVANYEMPFAVKSEEVELIRLDDDDDDDYQPSQASAVIVADELPPPLQPTLQLHLQRSTRSVARGLSTTIIVETSAPIVPSLPPPPLSPQSTGEGSSGVTPVRARVVQTKESALKLAKNARRESARVGGVYECQHCSKHFKKHQALVGHRNKAHSRRSLTSTD